MANRKPQIPQLLRSYHRYLDRQETAQFVSEVAAHYTLDSLIRLAGAIDSTTRRAAALAIGLLGSGQHADALARLLSDSDRGVRMLADDGLRELWIRSASTARQHQLRIVTRLNAGGQCREAICVATALLNVAPSYAEAWYQRSVSWAEIEQPAEALADARHAMRLCPTHFLAAARIGNSYLSLGDAVAALAAFREALRLNPGQEYIRLRIRRLQKLLK